jgi:hypothetical protein
MARGEIYATMAITQTPKASHTTSKPIDSLLLQKIIGKKAQKTNPTPCVLTPCYNTLSLSITHCFYSLDKK